MHLPTPSIDMFIVLNIAFQIYSFDLIETSFRSQSSLLFNFLLVIPISFYS